MVDENDIEGAAKDIGEKAQEALADVTGSTCTGAKGKWEQVACQAQKTFGAAAGELRDNVTHQPLAALAVAGGTAFVLGLLLARR